MVHLLTADDVARCVTANATAGKLPNSGKDSPNLLLYAREGEEQ